MSLSTEVSVDIYKPTLTQTVSVETSGRRTDIEVTPQERDAKGATLEVEHSSAQVELITRTGTISSERVTNEVRVEFPDREEHVYAD